MSTDEESRRTVRYAALTLIVVLVVAVVIQGATVQHVGFGPLSVDFSSKSTSPRSDAGDVEHPPSDSQTTAAARRPDRSVKGSWPGGRAPLTLAVTEVDVTDGIVQLHISRTSTATASIDMPLFGEFIATDDTGDTYQADNFDNGAWPISVPSGRTTNGVITLVKRVPAGRASLTISFGHVYSSDFSVPDDVSVSGIPIPS